MSTTRTSNVQVARCLSAEPNFPMLEWILIVPSNMFWRLNVDMTFADLKAEMKAHHAPSDVEKFVIVTFQSQSASLSGDAKLALDAEEKSADREEMVEQKKKKKKKKNEQLDDDAGSDAVKKSGETYMYTPEVQEWKDLCRENVVAFSKAVRRQLEKLAPLGVGQEGDDESERPWWWWFDAVDPATGQPLETAAGPSLYSESDAIEQLLRLPVVSVGVGNSVCRLVQHPKHGLDVYPSTLFFVGPRALISEALSSL